MVNSSGWSRVNGTGVGTPTLTIVENQAHFTGTDSVAYIKQDEKNDGDTIVSKEITTTKTSDVYIKYAVVTDAAGGDTIKLFRDTTELADETISDDDVCDDFEYKDASLAAGTYTYAVKSGTNGVKVAAGVIHIVAAACSCA